MTKSSHKIILSFPIVCILLFLMACSQDLTDSEDYKESKGVPLYAEVMVEGYEVFTRKSIESDDRWSTAGFTHGDQVGLFAMKGIENPEMPGDFSYPASNLLMEYEGRIGNNYRFGNQDIIMDATTISNSYSILYYPYYQDMPGYPFESGSYPGLPIREMDTDNIEKCIDFMHTTPNRIEGSNGVLTPTFKHQFFTLAIQRGKGFQNAEDKNIWVVMINPSTDVRFILAKASTSPNADYVFTLNLQYNPPDGEDVLTDIEGHLDFQVNKYAVWKTWDAKDINGVPTKHVVCPYDNVYFILIQDDSGKWQKVTDFTLGSGKRGSAGMRYVLSIEMADLEVRVRPIYIENWDDEVSVSDNRKKGINDFAEYVQWVTAYNSYIEGGRKETDEKDLLLFGDGTKNGSATSWRFYINNDFTFQKDKAYQVKCLQDTLEGSSTYTNYTLSNLRTTMFKEISESGVLRSLDFEDLYIISPENDSNPSGAIVDQFKGGQIENCNIFNGVIMGWGATGMVAGQVYGGLVKDCYFSGDVIGKSEDTHFGGMFGSVDDPTALTITNVDCSGLMFISNN